MNEFNEDVFNDVIDTLKEENFAYQYYNASMKERYEFITKLLQVIRHYANYPTPNE